MREGSRNSADHFFWLHVPKCAGTYLKTALLQSRAVRRDPLGERCVRVIDFPSDYDETFERISRFELNKKRAIRHVWGHMRFGLHNYFPGSSQYITVLRDPVERVISHYYFVVGSKRHPLHEQVRFMSLRDYVESGITCEVHNGQARMIAGRPNLAWYGAVDRQFDDNDYASALANLGGFYHVGFQDRLGDTIRELNLGLGLGLIPTKRVINATRNKPRSRVSEGDIDAILRRNGYDILLYSHCKTRYRLTLLRKGLGLMASRAF